MTKKLLYTIIALIIILAVACGAYWYFFIYGPAGSGGTATTTQPTNGFAPLGRAPGSTGTTGTSTSNGNGNSGNGVPTNTGTPTKVSALRLLSNTPVGGYGASTTASTTVVRWIDRGRGNVLEAKEGSISVATLSNTLLPRVYDSAWNKNLTAFVGSILPDGADVPTTIYAEIKIHSTSTAAINLTGTSTEATGANAVIPAPFELKGKDLPDNMIGYAVSPAKDKVFMLVNESGRGVGYISNFNGGPVLEIFDTPLTQLNVSWPEANTIAITTKGSATQGGFLYFVNPKTGAWKKILGPISGLSAIVSHDAKYAIVSAPGNSEDVTTYIYKMSDGSQTDAIIKTLADKCAWGNFYADIVYCAVPSQPVAATYPDDWYTGTISTIDKIWQVNAATGEVHLISSIVDQSDRVIDAFNLGLDPKDDYLFFMNKNDLSLWSLDLVSAH